MPSCRWHYPQRAGTSHRLGDFHKGWWNHSLWNHLLHSDSFFPQDPSLCQADKKRSQPSISGIGSCLSVQFLLAYSGSSRPAPCPKSRMWPLRLCLLKKPFSMWKLLLLSELRTNHYSQLLPPQACWVLAPRAGEPETAVRDYWCLVVRPRWCITSKMLSASIQSQVRQCPKDQEAQMTLDIW